MKPFLVCFLGLLLAARAASPDNNVATAKKTDVQLIVDLLDGSRIIGQPEADSLKMKTEYASIEIPLSSLRAIEFGDDHVARATLANGDVLAGNPGLPSLSLKTSFGRVEIPFDQVQKIRAHAISAVPPFVNSLGMKFVPLQGTDILVSIWDTRVQDYRAYAQANPNVDESWKNPDFQQGPDHPVVNVTWYEARAFCAWLTQKEHKEGKITQNQEYRLPTDKEWSAAAGDGKFPWGNQWPPLDGVIDITTQKAIGPEHTFAAGSFDANPNGLYDLSGNIWQWCEDWYRTEMNDKAFLDKYPPYKDDGGGRLYHVTRGASRATDNDPMSMLSSVRGHYLPNGRAPNLGFRCVLAPVETAP